MPKRRELLGIGRAEKLPEFSFNPVNLERALGRKISLAAFDEIIKCCVLYLMGCSAELSSVSLREFATQAARLNGHLHVTRMMLTEEQSPKLKFLTRRTFLEERNAIKKLEVLMKGLPTNFVSAGALSLDTARLDAMDNLLRVMIVICDWIQFDFLYDKRPGHTEGYSWENWIWQLTSVMRRHGLPFQVNKDLVHPRAKVSSFVLFVEELQKQFPYQYRRHQPGAGVTKDALAQAITRARREWGDVDFDVNAIFNMLSSSRQATAKRKKKRRT